MRARTVPRGQAETSAWLVPISEDGLVAGYCGLVLARHGLETSSHYEVDGNYRQNIPELGDPLAMTTYNYNLIEGLGVDIKIWNKGVPVEESAIKQVLCVKG